MSARMDPEKTAPFELGAGEDACLLLHGFTGSPWELRPLGEALAARGYFVRTIRLPGHGTTPEAMAQVTHRDWEQATEDALLSLTRFRRIYVAGLSVGALLGLLLASRHPDKVHGLALMAPALRFRRLALRFIKHLRLLSLVERVQPFIHKNSTDISDPDVLASAPVLPAFPSARLRDVWILQEKTLEALPRVRVSTLIAMAAQDHVVSLKGGMEIAQGLTAAPLVRFIQFEHGFHIMPRDRDRAALATEVGTFFDQLRQGR